MLYYTVYTVQWKTLMSIKFGKVPPRCYWRNLNLAICCATVIHGDVLTIIGGLLISRNHQIKILAKDSCYTVSNTHYSDIISCMPHTSSCRHSLQLYISRYMDNPHLYIYMCCTMAKGWKAALLRGRSSVVPRLSDLFNVHEKRGGA